MHWGSCGRVAVTGVALIEVLGPRSSGEPITCRMKSANRSGQSGPRNPDPPQRTHRERQHSTSSSSDLFNALVLANLSERFTTLRHRDIPFVGI